jgi:hypothetical protein
VGGEIDMTNETQIKEIEFWIELLQSGEANSLNECLERMLDFITIQKYGREA